MDNKQESLKYENFIEDVRKGIYSEVQISEAFDLQQRIEEDNVILYGLS